MARIAPESLETLRSMPAEQIYETVRTLAYAAPEGGGSEEYLELMNEMVEQGLLTREEIEWFEEGDER